ncbi:MAG: hypothetical protein JSU65_10730, partial [Candidatus Zixiibacteriota bacterium]
MRSRSLVLIVGLFLVPACLLIAFGCSDDDPAPTQITDETNDSIANPYFVPAQDQVEEFVGATESIIHDGLSFSTASAAALMQIVFGPYVPQDSSSDTWTIFFLLEAGAQMWGLDSIQFCRNGVPQSDGHLADQINYKHYLSFRNNDTTVTFTDHYRHSDFALTGLDGSTATVNGLHEYEVQSKFVYADSTVWWSYNLQATFANWTVLKNGSNWTTGCPTSGTGSVAVSVTYQKDAGTPVTTDWEFDLTMTDGSMEVE